MSHCETEARPIVLLDVMDTLVYNPFNREIPAYFAMTQASLLRQKHPTAWVAFETGQIDETEYLDTYFEDGRRFHHAAFQATVEEAYRWVEGAEQLLRDLHQQGYELHAFSNYPIWYRTIEKKLQLSRYLQWTFVSCLTGFRKPDPESYLEVSRHLSRPLTACLLVDDNLENCLAAERQGLDAIHFSDPISLRHAFAERGLVT